MQHVVVVVVAAFAAVFVTVCCLISCQHKTSNTLILIQIIANKQRRIVYSLLCRSICVYNYRNFKELRVLMNIISLVRLIWQPPEAKLSWSN